MEFEAFKDWALLGLLSGALWMIWQLKQSLIELKITVAVLAERMLSVNDRIMAMHTRMDLLDKRLVRLESQATEWHGYQKEDA